MLTLVLAKGADSGGDGGEGGGGLPGSVKGFWTPFLRFHVISGTPDFNYLLNYGEYEYFPDRKLVKVKGAMRFQTDGSFSFVPLGISGLPYTVNDSDNDVEIGNFFGAATWKANVPGGMFPSSYFFTGDAFNPNSLRFSPRAANDMGTSNSIAFFADYYYSGTQSITFEAIYRTV